MKPKIAMLISGRATSYESCLINVLKNSSDYDIDLFMSINNNECKYFEIMKEKLSPFLKNIYIKEYVVPDSFINTSTHPYCVKQLINNKYIPLNILSMWFNYNNAFKMACNYEENHSFKYDFFMTFRSDIIIDKIPLFKEIQENTLYSINQPCQFISFGIYKTNIVSPEWVYGKKNIIEKYMGTYDYIFNKSKIDNNYICHYESNVTDNCIEQKINIVRIEGINYHVDANRRRFDNWEVNKDTRIHNIQNRNVNYTDIFKINEQDLIMNNILS